MTLFFFFALNRIISYLNLPLVYHVLCSQEHVLTEILSNQFSAQSYLALWSILTWNDHIKELLKKASRKRYFLVQLKRTRAPSDDLVAYYCGACIRSSLDYACPVFHYALPKYQQVELEGVQKRALSFIFPGVSYNDALSLAGSSWTNFQSAFSISC